MDAGCGTGYYGAQITRRLDDVSSGGIELIGFDVSKDAVMRCAKSGAYDVSFVGDVWAAWPVMANSIDVVMSVFSPKNLSEMARVLKPAGRLLNIFAGEQHLKELCDRYGLMGVGAGKMAHYQEAVKDHFSDVRTVHLQWQAHLNRDEVQAAVLMGPNGKHRDALRGQAYEAGLVSFDVHIMVCSAVDLNVC